MTRILLVDDDDDVLATLKSIFEAAGHEVEALNDSRKLMQTVGRFAPDVVLLDVVMPEPDGLACLELLKAGRPDLPVAVMTGGGGVAAPGDLLERAGHLGADAVMEKPLQIKALIAILDRLTEIAAPGATRM
ncbi:MAG: response regulator [Acetobacterales bacterium]